VDALRDLAEELRATAEALEDAPIQDSPITGLEFENWNRVQDVLRELQQRGVDVQPLDRH
jgi:HPt (histidine-containing phosphotransfer) domain-containing protein